MDYPKLVAATRAVISELSGNWNEFLPKYALLPLLMLAVFGVSGLNTISTTAKVMPISIWSLFSLDNGAGQNMDAWLSIFTPIVILYFLEYFSDKDPANITCFLISCFLLPSLKNEGKMILAISMCIIFYIAYRRRITLKINRLPFAAYAVIIISLIHIAIWEIRKHQMGLHDDLDCLSKDATSRLLSRLNEQDIKLFLSSLFIEYRLYISPLYIFTAAMMSKFLIPSESPSKVSILVSIQFPILFFTSYLSILTWTYFTTYHDFAWHIETSAFRVIQPIQMVSLIPILLFLSEIERQYLPNAIPGNLKHR